MGSFWEYDDRALVPVPSSSAAAPKAPARRVRASGTKPRRRAPKLKSATAPRVAANGAVLDDVRGGEMVVMRQRAANGNRRPQSDRPLEDFENELRVGKYGIDNACFVTDPGVIGAVLARADRALMHHVLTPRLLALQYDFAMFDSGSDERCGGSFEHVLRNLDRLRGKVVPLCGKLPRYRSSGKENKYSIDAHLKKLVDPSQGLNDYALHPVFVSVNSEFSNDQGGILMQGVVVSAMAFNAPMGHASRLVTGLGDAFDDTWAAMLVTHTYTVTTPGADAQFGGIPWSAINPRRTCNGAIDAHNAEGRNMFDDLFRWTAYVQQHPDDASTSKFALTESKQVKGLLRRLLPPKMTLRDAAAVLHELRERGTLETELATRRATLTGQRASDRRTLADLVGNDIRKCLLAEMLLVNTSLHGAWTGRVEDVALPPLPADLSGFFASLRSFLRTRLDAAGCPCPASSYQSMYEQFYGQYFLAPLTDDVVS